ncbi:MAG: T9SS type A sorting domain-containing protein, partial [Ignavibacteriaceae bacterium]|nr:T9SS type A sorting domain-containing protein [Ignavibacteriaceae bacterium]
GSEVATLVDKFQSTGSYEVTLQADNLSSGIYFYQLQAGSFKTTKELILLK